MKPLYTKTFLYFLSLLIVTTFVSCGTVQNVASDDGIYADDTEETSVIEQPTRKVIVADTKRNENNYFTKELERLEDLKGTDIITDIENYKSKNYTIEGSEKVLDKEKSKTRITYNQNAPWGYNSSNADVVVNINTFGGGYGWNTYSPSWDPYWDNWGWNNNWRWNYRYWHPYHNDVFISVGIGYDPFYCPPYSRYGYYEPRYYNGYPRYYNGYYNNRYYDSYYSGRNVNHSYRSGRRTYSSSRNNNVYRRDANSSRRNSEVYRRSSRSSRYDSGSRNTYPSSRSSRSSRNNGYSTPSRSSYPSSRSSRDYTPQRSSRSSSMNRNSYPSSRRSSSSRSSRR